VNAPNRTSGIAHDDAEAMRAFVHGALYVSASRLADTAHARPVKVEQQGTPAGYEPYFLIRLASGIVLRVDVSVEEAGRG
jgi:hypothetical protein